MSVKVVAQEQMSTNIPPQTNRRCLDTLQKFVLNPLLLKPSMEHAVVVLKEPLISFHTPRFKLWVFLVVLSLNVVVA